MKPFHSQDGIDLYHGRAEVVLPLVPDGAADLVFTSPPYSLGVTSGGGFASSGNREGKWGGGSLADGYGGHDDAMPYPEYVAWQQEILRQCWRIIPDTGAIFYNHKPRVQDGEVRLPLEMNPGLPVRQIVIWARAGGINFAPTHYCPTHEWIVVFAKPGFRLKSKGASGVGDVWYVPQEPDNPHPAPFPITLPARAIETAAPKTVLDPFSGSGTVLRAAKDAGVKGIGIEREKRWCDWTVGRLRQGVLFGGMAG